MRLLLAIVLTLVLNIPIQAKQITKKFHWTNTKNINTNWLYLEKDTEEFPKENNAHYVEISLPHTWNSKDVLQTKEYRRASSWYRKNISFTKEQLNQRTYIRFGAAAQQAKVYLNGKLLTHHIGGYSAFTCEITNDLKSGDNQIDVWVSNKDNKNIAPRSGDFNFYGGLYRSVELISAPAISISRKNFGGPGVRVWSEKVSDQESDINLSAILDNGGAKKAKLRIEVKVFDKNGHAVSAGEKSTILKSLEIKKLNVPMPNISNPELWSPEKPNLYRVEVKVFKKNKLIDQLTLKHGFRWFQFTANKGFFLNGKPYKLQGINRHQDYFGEGNAIPLHRHYDDIVLMKEAGINWLRLAHYQQNDYMLQVCDELGMLVWEEIPFVNGNSQEPAFAANLQSMMKDMIEQHFNHPAIVLWGMGNEVWQKDRGDGKANIYDLLVGLNNLIHKEDPVRKSVMVNGDNNKPMDFKIIEIPDVFGFNLYRGWYKTDYNDFTNRCEELHAMAPNKPLIISEFGAGSDMDIHTENPLRQDFSIEYQNDFLEAHLNQIEKMNWLCGVNRWAFADFGAAHRGDSKPHINQKGLVTFDRKKKDAYYLLQSKWSKTPMVYIEAPTWSERSGNPVKEYRVFTNMAEVELYHNGKSMGKQQAGFKWNVELSLGENHLLAKAKSGKISKEHEYRLHYQKERPVFEIKAANSNEANKAKYAIDGNDSTYWASDKKAELIIDLKRICLVNGVSIQFFDPSKHTYFLDIKGSTDGKNWTPLFSGKNNRFSLNETFKYPKQQEQRYIKIEAKGNKKNDFNAYIEIQPLITQEKAEKNLYEKIGAGED